MAAAGKVSIVVPVYKVESYIERCLRSLMAQTYAGEMEVILVDDGSPDGSIVVAERVIADYSGPVVFRIIRFPENRGLPIARNAGTDAATGEFLLYVDSDDALMPDCVEKLMRPMRQDPTLEMVVGDYRFESIDGYVPFEKNQFLREEDFNSRARAVEFNHRECFVMCWNKLMRRDFLERNRIRFVPGILAEDNLWTFHTSQYLSHLYTIPDITYRYCIRPDSMLTGTNRKVWERYRARGYEEIAAWLEAHGDPYDEAWHYSRGLLGRLASYPKTGGYGKAIRMFKRLLRRSHRYARIVYVDIVYLMTRTKIGGKVLQKGWALIKRYGK